MTDALTESTNFPKTLGYSR